MVRNVPQSLSVGGSGRGGGASSSSHGAGASINMDSQMQVAEQLVLDLRYPVRRERALLELSKVLCKMFHYNSSFISSIISLILHLATLYPFNLISHMHMNAKVPLDTDASHCTIESEEYKEALNDLHNKAV
ncbi:hypothetical protein T459_24681 [Capsicum annuum]|uniref:Uncharacterized protein n=1 Tax=Capsicum annuum TaxID=4072 RepID=A0A2G2YIL0_CAPAN|nr:hypothetical protein T459_24681 [Capsicum annuum]